ncbi:ABC transporter permease [Solemya velesiana gill symbiont]|nr:ABC transporter permease [Solemya velesiana gill symbiont]
MTWNIALPVLIVMSFAFAFTTDGSDLFKVGLIGSPDNQAGTQFLETRHIQFIPMNKIEAAVTKVERHQLDMLLDTSGARYWINDTSAKGYILGRLLNAGGEKFKRVAVSGDEIRYVDWLIPGILGMNIMFSSLFGVGYAIVRYRKNGVLKRLKATPLTALEFISAQIFSRLWLIALVSMMIYSGTDLFVNFRMYGSHLNLFIILILGTFCMISLSLIVAARMSNEEAANGFLNLMSWPMMLLSGVWFSLEGSPAVVQQLAQFLPLTHVIDAARAVMIDGAGFTQISHHLGVLVLMSALFLLIGARSFRWE